MNTGWIRGQNMNRTNNNITFSIPSTCRIIPPLHSRRRLRMPPTRMQRVNMENHLKIMLDENEASSLEVKLLEVRLREEFYNRLKEIVT